MPPRRPWSPARLVLALSASALLGCPSDGGVLDDDDATEGDDDDATEELPLEGAWEGTTTGVVVYGAQGSYACEGGAEATVDADDRATGSVDCTYSHTGDVCTFSFEELRVGGGQRDIVYEDCFGDGDATHSMWAANGQLYGRVQRLGTQVSVELSWTLEPVD